MTVLRMQVRAQEKNAAAKKKMQHDDRGGCTSTVAPTRNPGNAGDLNSR
jgi:hypothetical protein